MDGSPAGPVAPRRLGVTNILGLRRFPVVTAVVFGLTAASNLLRFVVPGMLRHLEPSPAVLHGDWWRTATALFTQDGGVPGTLSNLVYLVPIGTIAEQTLSRSRWLLCYFGAGLALASLLTLTLHRPVTA